MFPSCKIEVSATIVASFSYVRYNNVIRITSTTATNRFGNQQLPLDKHLTELSGSKGMYQSSLLAGGTKRAKGISQGVLQREM